jgi:hypothetical protein
MMKKSKAGNEDFMAEVGQASLDVSVAHAQLPAIIQVLRNQQAEETAKREVARLRAEASAVLLETAT